MHDPGKPDRMGSLIIADYGKGKFVYTGLSFRQLPAKSAYRLLANIIALNYKKGFNHCHGQTKRNCICHSDYYRIDRGKIYRKQQ
jgi:hypothetical protein